MATGRAPSHLSTYCHTRHDAGMHEVGGPLDRTACDTTWCVLVVVTTGVRAAAECTGRTSAWSPTATSTHAPRPRTSASRPRRLWRTRGAACFPRRARDLVTAAVAPTAGPTFEMGVFRVQVSAAVGTLRENRETIVAGLRFYLWRIHPSRFPKFEASWVDGHSCVSLAP
jgi:hypothetical protein